MYIKNVKTRMVEQFKETLTNHSVPESAKVFLVRYYKKMLNIMTVKQIHDLAEYQLGRITEW